MSGRKREEGSGCRHGSTGNLTSGLGIDKNTLEYTIYHAMSGEINIGECMIVHPLEHGLDLSVLPANRDLAGAEVELVDAEDPQHILKNLLKSVKKNMILLSLIVHRLSVC